MAKLEDVLLKQFGSDMSSKAILFSKTCKSTHCLKDWIHNNTALQEAGIKASVMIGSSCMTQVCPTGLIKHTELCLPLLLLFIISLSLDCFLQTWLLERAGCYYLEFPPRNYQPAGLHQCDRRRSRHSWLQPGSALRPADKWDSAAAGQWPCPGSEQSIFCGRIERWERGAQRAHQWIPGRPECQSNRSSPKYEHRGLSQKSKNGFFSICAFNEPSFHHNFSFFLFLDS